MTGKMGIGVANDGDSILYANEFGGQWEGSKNFYFALADINNDGNQDLKISYKEADRTWDITNLYLGSSYGKEDSLFSIKLYISEYDVKHSKNGKGKKEVILLLFGGQDIPKYGKIYEVY